MRTVISLITALILFSCSSEKKEPTKTPEAPVESIKKGSETYTEYYPNGVLKIKGVNVDGKRSGKWESYYATGYRWSEQEYRNGIRSGEIITYHPNGMMKYQGGYYNDERSGVWSFYDTLGIRIKKIDMDVNPEIADSLLKAKP